MSTAIYRRYRPDTFDAVIGQEHVTEPLKAALRSGRIHHAYLFSGPRGCGKTTSARIMARCLNCHEGPTDTPCGKCPSCIDLATGGPGSLDVIEIDAASHNGVDHARELRDRATYAPVRDRYKIYILDEAHMVTPDGFNALLKLVEEPPEHIRFIFATTSPGKVLGTIRSRTHHYPFRLVPPEILRGHLESISKQEGVSLEDGVLGLVLRAGGGSVRDSLSVLDQLIAGSADGKVSYQTAVNLLGYTDSALLGQMVDALAAVDGVEAFSLVERVVEVGNEPRQFLEDFLQRLRDMLIVSLAPGAGREVFPDLPVGELRAVEEGAQKLGAARLSMLANLVNEGLEHLVKAMAPRLQFELLIGQLLVALQAGPEVPAAPAGPPAPAAAAVPPRPAQPAQVQTPQPAQSAKPAPRPEVEQPVKKDAVAAAAAGWAAFAAGEEPAQAATKASDSKAAASAAAAEPQKPVRLEVVEDIQAYRKASPEELRNHWGEILSALNETHPQVVQAVCNLHQRGRTEIGLMELKFDTPAEAEAFNQVGAREMEQAVQNILHATATVRGVSGDSSAPEPEPEPAPEPAPEPEFEPAPEPEPAQFESAASEPAPEPTPPRSVKPAPEPEPEPAAEIPEDELYSEDDPEAEVVLTSSVDIAKEILGAVEVKDDERG